MRSALNLLGFSRVKQTVVNWLTNLRILSIVMAVSLLLIMTVFTIGVAYLAYQQISQTLAESRDQELAIVGAERLSEQMESILRGLQVLVDQPEIQRGTADIQQEIIVKRGRELLADLTNRDGGIIITDAAGLVHVTRPFRPDLMGQNLSTEPYFVDVQQRRRFIFTNIVPEPSTGQETIVIAVPIIDDESNEFKGIVAVRFYIDFQRLGQEIQKLKVGEQGTSYLVDGSGRLIYHPIDSLIGTDFNYREAVRQLRSGNRSGAITSLDSTGSSTIEGFAVVPITGWGLVIGEPWDQVVGPVQEGLVPVAVILLIGLIVVASAVSLAVQRVTDPIQNLVIQTQQVAAGDYDAQVSLGRIKEIRELGEAFNAMVQQIGRYRAGMRQYVADITNTQEEERKRIARELHDDTVQSLIAIGQRVELIKSLADNPDEVRSRLTDLRAIVNKTIVSVRQFSRDLRPLALEDLGLVAAMQYLVSQLEQSEEGITVNLVIEGEMNDLPSDMEIAVYRMMQESLNNIRKHAHATQVNVLAKFTPRQVRLTIQDNGQGFKMPETVTDLATQGSFGVMGLHERAQLFGGTLTITSQPGNGTIVEIVLPRYASSQLRLGPVSTPAESSNGASKSAAPETISEP